MTRVNPQAEATLRTIRDLHEPDTMPEAKDDLMFYWRGDEAAEMNADI
jgi:hypothetical protein